MNFWRIFIPRILLTPSTILNTIWRLDVCLIRQRFFFLTVLLQSMVRRPREHDKSGSVFMLLMPVFEAFHAICSTTALNLLHLCVKKCKELSICHLSQSDLYLYRYVSLSYCLSIYFVHSFSVFLFLVLRHGDSYGEY